MEERWKVVYRRKDSEKIEMRYFFKSEAWAAYSKLVKTLKKLNDSSVCGPDGKKESEVCIYENDVLVKKELIT
jgi:hypothetical protein